MVGKAYKNVFAHLVISVLLKKNSTDRPTDRPTNKGTDQPTDIWELKKQSLYNSALQSYLG